MYELVTATQIHYSGSILIFVLFVNKTNINTMKTSIVVAILSAFALVAPAQASTKLRGVIAEEKKTGRTLKAIGMTKEKKMKGADMIEEEEEEMAEEEEMVVFFSLMNAAQEGTPCMSQASGSAIATFDAMSSELCIKLSYSGLSGPELFSHIHGPAKIGANAGSIFLLSPNPIKTDCYMLNDEQMMHLEAGHLYFNVHSAMCPSGEIRGQILMSA
jgi:hypothetical protein